MKTTLLLFLLSSLTSLAAGPSQGAPPAPPKSKITTALWFPEGAGGAEEAIRFYLSVFEDSKIRSESRLPDGSLMAATFQLAGQEFLALNGGPKAGFTESVSLLVNCEDQAEVDELWAKLGAGGQPGRCGWLKDKYGLSWQIVPTVLGRMLGDKDPARARRVAEAMMQMQKIDIRRLQQAYDQR